MLLNSIDSGPTEGVGWGGPRVVAMGRRVKSENNGSVVQSSCVSGGMPRGPIIFLH